jgi:DNA invertase Pin-like site-specific DNA recombinase
MMSLTAFADELEREKARQRTYDAMTRKAKAGHVTGGLQGNDVQALRSAPRQILG